MSAAAPEPPFEPPRPGPDPAERLDPLDPRDAPSGPDGARIRARLARPAPVTGALAVALAAAYAASIAVRNAMAGGAPHPLAGLGDPLPSELLAALGAATPEGAERGEWWRLATAGFLHYDVIHIALNAFSLFAVGVTAERILGGAAILAAFFGGTFAAAGVAIAGGQQAASASGGILAVFAALLTAVRGPDVPAELARAVRRRIVGTVAVLIVIYAIAAHLFARAGVGVDLAPLPHAAGAGAGLALGVLLHAAIRRPEPLARIRSALACGALIAAGLGLLALGAPHVVAVARTAGDDEGWQAAASLPALARRTIDRFGVSIALPITWVRQPLEGEQAKHWEVFAPPERGGWVEVTSVPRGGSFGAPQLASPDAFLEWLRAQHERDGREVHAAPFARETVAGRPAWRIHVRYRAHGRELEEVRYIVEGGARSYMVGFAGAPRSTARLAARAIATLELHE